MLLRNKGAFHRGLYTGFSVFVNADRNKRGQTSRPVVEIEIQTSSNFEENINDCNLLLGCVHGRCNDVLLEFRNNALVWHSRFISVPNNLNLILHKDFCETR